MAVARLRLTELRALVAGGPPYGDDLLAALQHDDRAGAKALYVQCLRRIRRLDAEQARTEAMTELEDEARANGFRRIAGVDEAGRGPIAGPLVAAAVVLAEPVPGVNDSKQLSAGRREALFTVICSGPHAVATAIIPPGDIDRMGIQNANYAALARAAEGLEPSPDFLLVDGFAIPGTRFPHRRVIKGDQRSQSIAAASIVAKVTRDRLLCELDRAYPGYGFARHKGYGTAEHIEAIHRLGPCPAHRLSFAPFASRADTGSLFYSEGS